MPFKTFSVGDVLTAADVNDYFMEQAVITCTSGTRPSSPVEGMTIYETDTDKYLSYNGSTWVAVAYQAGWDTYTPVWSGTGTGPSLGNGTITGRHRTVGSKVDVWAKLTLGSTSGAGTGSVYSISLPSAPRVGSLLNAMCEDSSAGSAKWAGIALITTASATGDNMRIIVTAGSTGVSTTVPFSWANGDSLWIAGTYENN